MISLETLLLKTSRTFGLSIPLLPEPTRTDVTLAYLVFRIADSLEDGDNLKPRRRIEALGEFEQLLSHPQVDRAQCFAEKWSAARPCEEPWHVTLIAHSSEVIEAVNGRDAGVRRTIFDYAGRSANGMAAFLRQADDDGALQLQTLDELRQYCYCVAGLVGEMLTSIFVQRLAATSKVESLRRDARWFGEGLQLVNILKDAAADARHGRRYLPPDTPIEAVFDLARQDLNCASSYVETLREIQAPGGVVAFTQLPVRLAHAALRRIEEDGSGAKVPRTEVAKILREVLAADHA